MQNVNKYECKKPWSKIIVITFIVLSCCYSASGWIEGASSPFLFSEQCKLAHCFPEIKELPHSSLCSLLLGKKKEKSISLSVSDSVIDPHTRSTGERSLWYCGYDIYGKVTNKAYSQDEKRKSAQCSVIIEEILLT